jgi:hypothetical protein
VVRGIIRPCRHTLGPELHAQWRSHLCGTCLTVRAEAGQAPRALVGYDILLLSVLVEAQAGPAVTVTARRCPLRGMQTATVVAASSAGARLAAAAALLAGAATLDDKTTDGDFPSWTRPLASAVSRRAGHAGTRMAGELGFPADTFANASRRAAESEAVLESLDALLAPSGAAVASMFAHTASLARRPQNAEVLAAMGDAFGRLVHLHDAVDDYDADCQRGAFNPLVATGTSLATAHRLAQSLAAAVTTGLDDLDLVEPALVGSLLGPVLSQAVRRTFRNDDTGPVRSAASVALAIAGAAPLMALGLFRRRRYRDDYGPRGGGSCDSIACCCCEEEACSCCCDAIDCS